MAKPTEVYDWALLDQNDPVSGQPNVLPPSTAEQNYGYAYQSRPTRQKLNHLFRAIAKLFHWYEDEEIPRLDDAISDEASDRATADGVLQGNIDDVASDLSDEVSARATAEGILQDNIDDVASDLSDEVSARSTADGTLQDNIDTLDGRIDDYDGDNTELLGLSLELFGFTSNLPVTTWGYQVRHRGATGTFTEIALWIPATSDTSVDTTLGFDTSAIPASLRPDVDQTVSVICYNSSDIVLGVMGVQVTGNWSINLWDGSAWSPGGTKGVLPQLIRYRKSLV
jgi:hypothetical protein